MDTASETVVLIPPPDEEHPPSRLRWLGILVIVLAVGVAVLFGMQTAPRLPAFAWSARSGPPGPINLDTFVPLSDGFAVLSGVTREGVSIWWDEGDGGWQSQVLPDSPSQLAAGNDRVAAYRTLSGRVLGLVGGRWQTHLSTDFPAETRFRQASGRPGIVVTDDGLLEMSLYGDVWWSERSSDFIRVVEDPSWGQGVEQPFTSECRPPSRSSPDVPPVVVGDGVLHALVSSHRSEPFGMWPVCEPVLWTSLDGPTWSSQTTSLTGGGAYVYDLAWRDGMFVAVGGRGIDRSAVWASTDGFEWAEITPATQRPADLYRVEAGPAGWVILGRESAGARAVGWTSVDGSCWESITSPVSGSEAVVSRDQILVVDRTTYPSMWLGTPSGYAGMCR